MPQVASDDEEAVCKKHNLSFTVPSSVAAQIDGTTCPRLIIALNEVKDDAGVILDADTRVLASEIFSKIISKQTQLKESTEAGHPLDE